MLIVQTRAPLRLLTRIHTQAPADKTVTRMYVSKVLDHAETETDIQVSLLIFWYLNNLRLQ